MIFHFIRLLTMSSWHWRLFTDMWNFLINTLEVWVPSLTWCHSKFWAIFSSLGLRVRHYFQLWEGIFHVGRTFDRYEYKITHISLQLFFFEGGEIQETSKKNVLKAIAAQDLLQEVKKTVILLFLFLLYSTGGDSSRLLWGRWLGIIVPMKSTTFDSIEFYLLSVYSCS